jgi:uncharacterized protein (DUF302 family)
MKYYIEKTLNTDFESATDKVKKALSTEGFGVLSEFDADKKFKEALGKDFRKYRILGACNPEFAYQALSHEDKIGTLLPCSVILQEWEEDKVEVAVVDPYGSMAAVENKKLEEIASEVREKLKRVVDAL